MTMSIEHHIHAPTAQKPEKPGFDAPGSIMTGRKQTVSPPIGVEGLSAESITSVPNPFAVSRATPPTSAGGTTGMPNAVSDGSMASINWATAAPAGQIPVTSAQPTASVPPNIAASGIRFPAATPGIASQGIAPQPVAPAPQKKKTSSPPQKKEPASASPVNNRRQKRLERNRESARLSRRRRKQYLEVLEDRVDQLSLEMDKGRREHVAVAIPTLQQERQYALEIGNLAALETILSRSSDELRVAATFQTQQLRNLVFPPHAKFLLWLTLQSDTYFRGGRAASERLSAARIGERMLSSGNDRVSPAHGMWPLFCNEVGLSYDQEERIRCAQRVLVQTPETWIDRHTSTAGGLAMQSAHDCMQAVSNTIEKRDSSIMNVLTDEQRIRFLQWAANNKHRLTGLKRNAEPQDGYAISPTNHEAANLYIINHRLQRALNKLPTPPALVVGSSVKRLSRRPAFESLGSSEAKKEENRALSREGSFNSSGSLKRSASEMSLDGEVRHGQSVSPDVAEVAAQPTLDAVLGSVKGIMPLRPQPQPEPVISFKMPPPKPNPALSQTSTGIRHPFQSVPPQQVAIPSEPTPQAVLSAPSAFQPAAQAVQQQQPVASFLPQPLNAVPEEDGGFLGQQGSDPADDFLFELAEEDWAIGEGFEMDTNP